MKKLIALLLALTAALTLAACGGNSPLAPKLVGTWKTEPGAIDGYDIEITFDADGSLTYRRSLGEEGETLDGTYRLDGDNTLTMVINGDEMVLAFDEGVASSGGFFWYLEDDLLIIDEAKMHRG